MKLEVDLGGVDYPLVVITPTTRLDHLPYIEKSIRMAMEQEPRFPVVWWQSHAAHMPIVERHELVDGLHIVKTKTDIKGKVGGPERNDVLDALARSRKKCRVCFLDDDNLMMTSYLKFMHFLMKEFPDKGFFYDQVNLDGSLRCIAAPQNVRPCGIDTAQGCIPMHLIGDERWDINLYEQDGKFYETIYKKAPLEFLFVNRPLCAYNALV